MNVFKVVGGLFLALGITLLAVSAYLYFDISNFIERAKSADGQVIDLVRHLNIDDGKTSYTFAAVVRFTDDAGLSHEFTESSSSNPPRYLKGDAVKLLYEPENPINAMIDDFWGRWAVVAIVASLGALFALVGAACLFSLIYGTRKDNRLRSNGISVFADFMEVERDRAQSKNGRHPYRVIAQGLNPVSGKLEQYISRAIWVDPTQQLIGKRLRIFIDPYKPSRHLVDLGGLAIEASSEHRT